MIADVLRVSIDEIRAAKENQFFYEFAMPPTDDEVDEFIVSSSCFDEEMKRFLLSEGVSKNDIIFFERIR
ncbi:hypothetical protein [Parafilimonas terrae]|uniref:Uncharacterized protein n=1 Tax=Parafilimonas terrae TaxID=1465490 RepID=A0A1I5VLT5_9BACT|nr:hypothetical protein [Parafilimonas terrae]SFQ08382.1 hypothetical protein SAMN05444277_10566 [Parafilimonas terrae]